MEFDVTALEDSVDEEDGQPDHDDTNRLVRQALASAAMRCRMLEYPVWAWHCWPWVRIKLGSRSDLAQIVPATAWANLRLALRLNPRIPVAAVLAQKRRALDEHRSQMSRMVDDPRWLTLHDVGGGEFLANFDTENEFYAAG